MGGIMHVRLSCGRTATIDQEDWPLVRASRWRLLLQKDRYTGYALRPIGLGRPPREQRMHRLILGPLAGVVDHINGDGLDNRRSNLRVVTPTQNSANRRSINRNNRSGFRGVYHRRQGQWAAWAAKIGLEHVGFFRYAEAAARAYDAAAIARYGEFARLNFPPVAAPAPACWVDPFSITG